MKTTFLSFGLGIGLSVASAAGLMGGCSSDENKNDPPKPGDPLPDGGFVPIPAEFGLDQRPSNTTCLSPKRPSSTASVKFERVFENVSLGGAVAMQQIPGDSSRWFVALKGGGNPYTGKVVSFPVNNPPNTPTQLLTLPVTSANEGGLLGLAIHPRFRENGHIYLSAHIPGGSTNMRSTVVRYTSPGKDGNAFGQRTDVIAPFEDKYENHNGGTVAFGKDGYLYISFGDGGGGGDPDKHGQEKTSFFSKILRIDVDRGNPYAIPNDNPFRNEAGSKPEIFAYGFRNPWRFTFDRASGDMWVGDVGQNAWEEVDGRIKSGGNYGWSKKEGTHCYPANVTSCPGNFIEPDYEYPNPGGRAVTGGYVYRGNAIPEIQGNYIFGDSSSGEIWMRSEPGGGKPAVVTRINESGPSGQWGSFAEDNDGEIYAMDLGGGKVYKLVRNSAPEPSNFPELLSQTGCVDPSDAKKPATGMIPYGVNSALWSDGAEKERYLAIPNDKKIHVKADGDFELPVGSVLVKTFHLGGKRIETRLFVYHDDGDWAGYTYEWNDAQTDATLLRGNKTKPVGDQIWYYPSGSDCMSCHSTPAGRSLGLEIGQLNGEFVYPSTRRISNQLATLDHIGMFDGPLGGAAAQLTKFPNPTDPGSGNVSDRAFSYLHANCSFCHRPGSIGGGQTDLRYSTPLADKKACGAAAADTLGIDGAKIVTPGDPGKSVLSVRPHRTDGKRMPPVATRLVDTAGTGVIDEWIRGLTSCSGSGDGGRD